MRLNNLVAVYDVIFVRKLLSPVLRLTGEWLVGVERKWYARFFEFQYLTRKEMRFIREPSH